MNEKFFKFGSFKKLKDLDDKDFMYEFNMMVEDNHIELLNKIPELKKHVKDYETYLPKIQIIHSQMHRKKMVKD